MRIRHAEVVSRKFDGAISTAYRGPVNRGFTDKLFITLFVNEYKYDVSLYIDYTTAFYSSLRFVSRFMWCSACLEISNCTVVYCNCGTIPRFIVIQVLIQFSPTSNVTIYGIIGVDFWNCFPKCFGINPILCSYWYLS